MRSIQPNPAAPINSPTFGCITTAKTTPPQAIPDSFETSTNKTNPTTKKEVKKAGEKLRRFTAGALIVLTAPISLPLAVTTFLVNPDAAHEARSKIRHYIDYGISK